MKSLTPRAVTAALLLLAAILAALLLWRGRPAPLGGEALDDPKPLPALALLNERGQPTTLATSDGRLRLVFYGFVRCPDVCPATLASLKNSYAALTPAQQQKVQVQFITVDPEHDTPAMVRDYLARFDPAFTGLTGKAAAIDEAARQMFVANVKPLPAQDHSAHTGGQQGSGADNAQAAGASAAQAARLHGDQVSVVDGQGRFVRMYGNAAVIDGTLDRDLPGLIRQYAN